MFILFVKENLRNKPAEPTVTTPQREPTPPVNHPVTMAADIAGPGEAGSVDMSPDEEFAQLLHRSVYQCTISQVLFKC